MKADITDARPTIAVLLLLQGCVAHYHHPTMKSSEIDVDMGMCADEAQLEAEVVVQSIETASIGEQSEHEKLYKSRYEQVLQECLESKGWHGPYRFDWWAAFQASRSSKENVFPMSNNA